MDASHKDMLDGILCNVLKTAQFRKYECRLQVDSAKPFLSLKIEDLFRFESSTMYWLPKSATRSEYAFCFQHADSFFGECGCIMWLCKAQRAQPVRLNSTSRLRRVWWLHSLPAQHHLYSAQFSCRRLTCFDSTLSFILGNLRGISRASSIRCFFNNKWNERELDFYFHLDLPDGLQELFRDHISRLKRLAKPEMYIVGYAATSQKSKPNKWT